MSRAKNRKCEICLSLIKGNDVSIKCKNLTCKKKWHSSCAEKAFNIDLNDIVSSFRWTCPECRDSRSKQKLCDLSSKNLRSEMWADKLSGDNKDMSKCDSKVLLSMLIADQKDSQQVLLALAQLMKELLEEKSQMKSLSEENEELKKAMIAHLVKDKIQLQQISSDNESLKEKLEEIDKRIENVEKRTLPDYSEDSQDKKTMNISQEDLSSDEDKTVDKKVLTASGLSSPNDSCIMPDSPKVEVIKDIEIENANSELNTQNEFPKSFQTTVQTCFQDVQNEKTPIKCQKNDAAVFPSNSSLYVPNRSTSADRKPWQQTRKFEFAIGRIGKSTTVETVNRYILKKMPRLKFDCELLNSSGPYANFKISVDAEHKDKLFSSSFWPPNVNVRRFYGRK